MCNEMDSSQPAHILAFSQEYAGLGGDAQFVKAEQEGSISRSLGAGYVRAVLDLELCPRATLTSTIRSPRHFPREVASSSLSPAPAPPSSPTATTSAGPAQSATSASTRWVRKISATTSAAMRSTQLARVC